MYICTVTRNTQIHYVGKIQNFFLVINCGVCTRDNHCTYLEGFTDNAFTAVFICSLAPKFGTTSFPCFHCP